MPFGLSTIGSPSKSEVLSEINSKVERFTNRPKKQVTAYYFQVMPGEVHINDLKVGDEFKKISLKIDLQETSVVVEFEQVVNAEAIKFKLHLPFAALSIFDVSSDSNILTIETSSYRVQKLTCDPTTNLAVSSLFQWRETSIIELLSRDVHPGDIRIKLHLEPDIAGTYLFKRYDALDSILAVLPILTVDQSQYVRHGARVDADPVLLFGQQKKQEPSERANPQQFAENAERANEEKVFEENLNRPEVREFENIDISSLSC